MLQLISEISILRKKFNEQIEKLLTEDNTDASDGVAVIETLEDISEKVVELCAKKAVIAHRNADRKPSIKNNYDNQCPGCLNTKNKCTGQFPLCVKNTKV